MLLKVGALTWEPKPSRPWVKTQIVPPVNISIPTQIGSKMGGAPIPKTVPLALNHGQQGIVSTKGTGNLVEADVRSAGSGQLPGQLSECAMREKDEDELSDSARAALQIQQEIDGGTFSPKRSDRKKPKPNDGTRGAVTGIALGEYAHNAHKKDAPQAHIKVKGSKAR